ncbi:MAG TPA: hypothetical protein VGR73_18615 [Bryobacteraceae bacterium]|nr:hypothetical protein [Bryobacteraceae bacterium]
MLKNVTITLDEEDLRWVRHQAAEKGVSVAKWFGQIVAEKRARRGPSYWAAFEQWEKLGTIPGLDASKRLTREEVYDRSRFL